MTPEESAKLEFIADVLEAHKETKDWFDAFNKVAKKVFDRKWGGESA